MFLYNISSDVVSIAVINYLTLLMYRLSYGKAATRYLDSELGVIGTSGISCSLVLNIYYYFENKYSMDRSGFILVIAFLIGGLISNYMYKSGFYYKSNIYKPNNNEYLIMASFAFLSISIRMAIHSIISVTVIFALLLGRLFWLDTKSLKEVVSNLKTDHKRIYESSIILLLGLTLSSLITSLLHLHRCYEIIFSLCYGLIVLFPYRYIRKAMKIK